MRLKHSLFAIAILFFLILGISVAQEQSGDQMQNIDSGGEVFVGGDTKLSGQDQTGVDSLEDVTSGAENTGYVDSGEKAELPTVLESIIIPDIVPFDIQSLPSLIISEVFFDGSDERLEITNIGGNDFSGNLILTGIGINTAINSSIMSEQSILIAKSGRTFGYILDQSVIKNYISMGFTDTKQINISLLYSGTILDTFMVETGIVSHYNDKLTSLEKIKIGQEYVITGTSLARTQNIQSGYLANPGKVFELFPEIVPPEESGIIPSVKITELYLDSGQRFELTNIGQKYFSGILVVSGAKTSPLDLNVGLLAGQSKVYGNTPNQILDTVVIGKTGLNISISQSKAVALQLLYSGIIIDEFLADSGYVKKYKGYNISFEKVGTGDMWITTKANLERRYNAKTGFVINPGIVYITGENMMDISQSPPVEITYTGTSPQECLTAQLRDKAEISEVFFGNAAYHSFIEIALQEDLDYQYFSLSGSALLAPLNILVDQELVPLEKNRNILITDSENWYNEGLNALDNEGLSLQKTGGRMLLYGWSGQNGQLLDIVYLTGGTTGTSLYYDAHDRDCAKVLDQTGNFSPGFERKFLQYFAVSTEPKIEYIKVGDAVAGTCPICLTETETGEITSGDQKTQILHTGNETISVKIINIDYDPEGSDTNNEKITLLAQLSSGESELKLNKPDRYLKIGTIKRYLSGLISNATPLTLQGTFGFPNSSKSGNAIVVQLWYQDVLIDTYSYLPKVPLPKVKMTKIKTNELTGTFLVTSVIDGDTIKILYSGGEQSIRFLGIDTPETTLLRNKKLGCFGQESKQYLTELLLGNEVHLSFDSTQSKTDSYKRRLNYVYLDDELINEKMLSLGYAKEYTFKTPYQMREQFLSAQQEAQAGELGLRNVSVCPENTIKTGEELSGIVLDVLSGLHVKISYVLPNPKGKDDKEEIGIKIEDPGVPRAGGEIENGGTISGFYLEINGKKKNIKMGLEIGIENILIGSLGLLNKAACVGIGYSGIILDNLCYEQPKEGQKIFADGRQAFEVTDQEQEVLNTLSFKTKGTQLCMMFGEMEVDCRNIPSGKTALKTANENKLYERFITIIESYLKDQWKDLYYNSNIKTYFTFLRADKKTIKAGVPDITTSHGNVPAYDLSEQIHILETYSLGYRAKKFGQVLLNEI